MSARGPALRLTRARIRHAGQLAREPRYRGIDTWTPPRYMSYGAAEELRADAAKWSGITSSISRATVAAYLLAALMKCSYKAVKG